MQQSVLLSLDSSSLAAGSTIISTVELEKAVLATANPEEFDGIRQIVEHTATIVWITGSGIHSGFDPTMSVFTGLSRAIMIEQPRTKIFSLELDTTRVDPEVVAKDIVAVLHGSSNEVTNYEYIKDGCGLMVSRVVPDELTNQQFREKQDHFPRPMSLAAAGPCRLSLQKPGHLSSACFIKDSRDHGLELSSDHVLVQVHCVGLNAKVCPF